MEQTLNTLAKFIDQDVMFTPSEEDLFEGKNFEIYEEGNDEMLGVCVLDDSDRMINYHFLGMYDKGDLKSDDMPAIAEKFIRSLYPQGLEKYSLQSVVDLDDVFLVTYGIKDEKLGLELHGIGFSLTIATNGNIVQFSFDGEPVKIIYPPNMLSEEEAKEKYASLIDFELVIRQMDSEIYANGSDTYQLVYAIKEAAVDIPASGEKPDIVAEGNQYEQIQPHDVPDASLHEMIGVTADHVKLGELIDEDCLIEKWIHSSMVRPEEIDFTEAYSEQIITIHYNLETKTPTMIYNGEPHKEIEEQLDEIVKQHRALDFLFTVFPQADECFLKEIEEPEEEEDDCFESEDMDEWDDADLIPDEEVEEEQSTPFYFRYHVNHVPVEESVTCIQVGDYSGKIVSATVEPVHEAILTKIQTAPVISKDEARSLLMKKLRMELSMALEYDEEGVPFYRPVYLPAYPETVGHIQAIDAENGIAYYVDIGGSVFF